MDIAIYGGSFNPPHLGHAAAVRSAWEQLRPDRFLIIPAAVPPHKRLPPGSPDGQARLELCRLAFSPFPWAEVLDLELQREGPSYTIDTLSELHRRFPGARLTLLMGSDMLRSFERWHAFSRILDQVRLGVFVREEKEGDAVCKFAANLRDTYGAQVVQIPHVPLPLHSTAIRDALPQRRGREALEDGVYAAIIRRRFYQAQPELSWLRERAYAWLKPSRIPHVRGCEAAAAALARRWGADADLAAEAGILHDITKKLGTPEQLELCRRYGCTLTQEDLDSPKTIHAITGALVARDQFGVGDAVYSAIRWHTTGRADMRLLEKIVYMADYMEPTRDFPGVERLRRLSGEDLDAAVELGLTMTLEEIKTRGLPPHSQSVEALSWLRSHSKG